MKNTPSQASRPLNISKTTSFWSLRLFALAGITFLSGCTTRLTDFTVISTKNVDFTQLSRARRGATRVRGDDVAHIIIIFPTKIPNLKEAIDRTIESSPGAVGLVDGVVYQRVFYIPYIYGQTAYVVEGTPLHLDSPKTSATSPRAGDRYLVATLDPSEKTVQLKPIDAQEFTRLAGRTPSSPF
jgi:hypothetical protein